MQAVSQEASSPNATQKVGIWVKHDDGVDRHFHIRDLLKPLPDTFPVEVFTQAFVYARTIMDTDLDKGAWTELLDKVRLPNQKHIPLFTLEIHSPVYAERILSNINTNSNNTYLLVLLGQHHLVQKALTQSPLPDLQRKSSWEVQRTVYGLWSFLQNAYGQRVSRDAIGGYRDWLQFFGNNITLTDLVLAAGCLSIMPILVRQRHIDDVSANVVNKYPQLFQDSIPDPQSAYDQLQNVIRISCAKYVVTKAHAKTTFGVTKESDGINRAINFFNEAMQCTPEQMPQLFRLIADQLQVKFRPGAASRISEGSYNCMLLDELAAEPNLHKIFGIQYRADLSTRKTNRKLVREFCLENSKGVDLSACEKDSTTMSFVESTANSNN